ncbi:MAG TPA: hypothetical protein VHU82_05085 [Vicinamibacterales bacterium]|jgi:hypothetical protein|nr:hypothetical protein [Vicinamibacterales bacterium]
MRSAPCVVSVAEHTGWAHLVCVAAPGRTPAVVERRRMRLIDSGLPTQPYEHDSIGMREDEGNALIARVKRSIAARTSEAWTRVVTELAPAYAVVALAIREPPFAELPESVAAVRASYRLQCAADGMLYQMAFCRTAQKLGLEVHQCRRGDETSWAASQLDVTPGEIDEFITRTGRPPGPPWTQEHRRAYAAGIAALALHMRKPMRIPRFNGREPAPMA